MRTLEEALEKSEREAYRKALTKAGGNRTLVASMLGINVATVKRRMAALGLREEFPAQPGRPISLELHRKPESTARRKKSDRGT